MLLRISWLEARLMHVRFHLHPLIPSTNGLRELAFKSETVLTREKTWCGMFVWTDIEQEESAGIADSNRVNGGMKMNLTWRVGRLEGDVRSQKFMTHLLIIAVFIMVVFLLAMYYKF
ncbi:uncharacterized protein DS421_2g39020 [Arachis hypogaea]|nr:uncharacterized protein DS421_2g39020 [Arachis hypogaea]